ncbi:hypothetical protein FV242_23985 [Methylobacterium sp. WL64]|uniref:AAA family ATPase n=1 Tax=Methylobacterium sp. WL64 TaxID=2603894 RepID=UPI0011C9E2AC|nr:hypothetical protein [Methylobacterium sp. WL64]TXM99879.1 hypothetical protein FV242_23985 [Methylobacterium sp. WL64]
MRCFIVGTDPSEVARLVRLSTDLGFPATVRSELDALRAEPSLRDTGRVLILVAGAGLAQDAGRLAADLAEHVFVVVVADAISAGDYKALVRTGSGEWVQWGSSGSELAELAKRFATPAHDARGAHIICFLPSKGGVGNTALLAEVAVHLASRRPAGRRSSPRIAALDLNLQGGTLADSLDIEPRFDLAEIAGRPERLDEQLVDVFRSRYGERFDVFAPPPREITAADIAANLIFTFIDAISPRYDAVLLDLPHAAFSWTDTLLQGSDAVVVTGIATVPGLRCLRSRLEHVESLDVGGDRHLAVVNGVATDLMGRFVRRLEIERALGTHRSLMVRRDVTSMDAAADSGQPVLVTAPDSRIGRDIRRLAEWVEAIAVRPMAGAGDSRESAA